LQPEGHRFDPDRVHCRTKPHQPVRWRGFVAGPPGGDTTTRLRGRASTWQYEPAVTDHRRPVLRLSRRPSGYGVPVPGVAGCRCRCRRRALRCLRVAGARSSVARRSSPVERMVTGASRGLADGCGALHGALPAAVPRRPCRTGHRLQSGLSRAPERMRAMPDGGVPGVGPRSAAPTLGSLLARTARPASGRPTAGRRRTGAPTGAPTGAGTAVRPSTGARKRVYSRRPCSYIHRFRASDSPPPHGRFRTTSRRGRT
jgi:hypothetical protein